MASLSSPCRSGSKRSVSAGSGMASHTGWSGAASTYYTIDPHEHLLAILMLQHLPRDDGGKDLPRISRNFYDLVYQALP